MNAYPRSDLLQRLMTVEYGKLQRWLDYGDEADTDELMWRQNSLLSILVGFVTQFTQFDDAPF